MTAHTGQHPLCRHFCNHAALLPSRISLVEMALTLEQLKGPEETSLLLWQKMSSTEAENSRAKKILKNVTYDYADYRGLDSKWLGRPGTRCGWGSIDVVIVKNERA